MKQIYLVIIRLLRGIVLSILFIFIQSAIISLTEYILEYKIRTHGVYITLLYTSLFIFDLFYLIIYEWVKIYPKIKWKFTTICCLIFSVAAIEFYRWDVFPPIQIALPIILITTILIREYAIGAIGRFSNYLYKKISILH